MTAQEGPTAASLEPDALGQLTTALQTACRKAYEQQLNFEDEVATSEASESASRWNFLYFSALAIVASCSLHWWHTSLGRRATLLLAAFVFVDWYVYHTLSSLLVGLCPWFLALLLELKLLLRKVLEAEPQADKAKHWMHRLPWMATQLCAEMRKLAQEKAAAKNAHKAFKDAKLEAQKASDVGNALWKKLAGDVTDVDAVKKFVARRQKLLGSGPALQVESVVRVVNENALKSFQASLGFDINPIKAGNMHFDTLLFHGTSEDSVPNIQAAGRPLVKFSKAGMLGTGIYGAPDPRKSLQYCSQSKHGKFMFICRYNLSNTQYAGPSTHHKNTIFEEFCVANDNHVVVLWMLKIL